METYQQTTTQTLILRSWVETDGNGRVPRYRLENPRTGEHWSFAHMEALLAFLQTYLPPSIEVAATS